MMIIGAAVRFPSPRLSLLQCLTLARGSREGREALDLHAQESFLARTVCVYIYVFTHHVQAVYVCLEAVEGAVLS